MRHLTESDLVDLADGRLSGARAAHAEACDRCRDRLAALQSALADARSDPGPEPSPLFWQHFAARVSEAVRDERPAPAAPPSVLPWMRNPAAAWATSASIAVLLMVTALWRATLHAPVPRTAPVAPPVVTTVPVTRVDATDADQAWAALRSATDVLAWDEVAEAGIVARPGSAEGVVLELTVEERAELARLVAAEMKRNGAL